MRESSRPIEEQARISKAMSVLAIATRDTTIDAGVKRVYMPHLDGYTVEEVERACAMLETESAWFPKVKELLAACSKSRRKFQDEADAARPRVPALTGPAPDPERHAEWMRKLRATAYAKRMPPVEVHDEQA